MKKELTESKGLLERARKRIPRASQTLSKAPDQFVEGVSPYAIAKAHGAYVWDIDGNRYIDLSSALGAVILGYRHPVVEEAVAQQRERGSIYTLPGDIEVELAERLHELIPFVEMTRFALNGSDVTSGAIRVARAYTGKEHVLKCGYHGWADWSIATNPLRSRGVPQVVKALTHEFSYNDLASLERLFAEIGDNVAAVVLEPMSSVLPAQGFLEGVRALATKHRAVLIFDELVTGFRVGMQGAAGLFGVEPDLVCYGKAISNGEPLSVLGGKREYMSVLDAQDVFFSFTYAGYLPGIAAALATLRYMETEPVHVTIKERGSALITAYNELASQEGVPTKAIGFAEHPCFEFKVGDKDNLLLKSLFIQEMALRGVITNCSSLMNYTHTKEILHEVTEALRGSFAVMGKALRENSVEAALRGPVIRPRSKPVS